MGTTTWTETCPRCGDADFEAGRDRESGEFGFCLRCGYGYRQQEYQMLLEDVNDMRKDLELQSLTEFAPALPGFAWRHAPCRRIRLNFHALPEPLYEALLDEFRRQFPDYESSEISWHWDIVASAEEHADAGAIFQMCFTPDLEELPEDE